MQKFCISSTSQLFNLKSVLVTYKAKLIKSITFYIIPDVIVNYKSCKKDYLM